MPGILAATDARTVRVAAAVPAVLPRLALAERLHRLREPFEALQQQPLDRAEAVHAARRTIRRLRLLLSLCRDAVAARTRRRIDARLAALGRRLGRVRDWDVLRAGLPAEADAALLAGIASERTQALQAVQRWLARRRYRRLCARLARVEQALRDRAAADAAAGPDLAPLLDRRWRRFRARLDAADPAQAESLHALRRQARQLQQAGDWSAAPARFLSALQAARDRLGAHQDAEMRSLLLARLGQPGTAADARVAAAAARQEAACLRRLHGLRPYWTAA